MTIGEKFRFSYLAKVMTNNFWLKIIALAIAIVLWFYLSGEIVTGVKV